METNNNLNQETKQPKNTNTKKKILKVFSYIAVLLIGIGIGGIFAEPAVPDKELTYNENNDAFKDDKPKEEIIEEVAVDEEAPVPMKAAPCPVVLNGIINSTDSIGSSTVNINYTNNGTEAVKYIEFYVCAWDLNGYPLKLNFGYDEYIGCSMEQPNTQPGEIGEYEWLTYSAEDKEVKEYGVIISKVELYDGTTWINNNALSEIKAMSKEVRK